MGRPRRPPAPRPCLAVVFALLLALPRLAWGHHPGGGEGWPLSLVLLLVVVVPLLAIWVLALSRRPAPRPAEPAAEVDEGAEPPR